MFEELWEFIKAHYEAKRYHLLLGNIQLLIPLFNQQKFNNLLDLHQVLELLQRIFIKLDKLASELNFRDYLHRYYIEPLYQRIKTFNSQLAESFLKSLTEQIPRSDLGWISYIKYEHIFQKFYNISDVDPTKQLREDHKKRITLLETNLERNQYAVWSDMVLSYLDAQLKAGYAVNEVQLTALLNFIEALLASILNASENEKINEKLWHKLFIAQRLLSNSLAQQCLSHECSCFDLSQWWKAHQTQATGLFLLPIIAQYTAKHSEEDCSVWYELAQQINLKLTMQVSVCQTGLFANHHFMLQMMRNVFNELVAEFNSMTPQVLIKAQQQFTQDTLRLLNQFVQNMAALLGEAPCDFALCALGSTSREDRRPYSDIELVLLYVPKANTNAAHLQTYLYYLVSGIDLAIKQCGESHFENADPTLLQAAGFHLDDSSHLLKKGLIGTPETIAQKFIFNLTQTWQAKGHPWLEDESFYSLLSPIVINADSHGSEQVLAEYKGLIQAYLNNSVAAEDSMELLTNNLSLMTPPWFNSLKRREVIALSCLVDVARKSKVLLTSLVPGEIVDDIKRAFYKPLAYLALNLKLFYGLNAKHPAEIFAEAAAKLSWGESQVLQLLQTALSYITHIQVKLHLEHGHQEERFIWLGIADENNAEINCLSAEEYAGLSLIKDTLLLPLCQWLETQLKTTTVLSFIEILPYLLKCYLAKRNESWLQRWTQHPTHALELKELSIHPLIHVLADCPCANGWSPVYEQTMCRWLSQLQTLVSEHKTACLIEGIPTSNQNVSYYLPQEIVAQLFDAKGEFKGNVHHSERSKVSQIILQIPDQANPTTFYFKVKVDNEAGLMGREFAVINLHQLLGGPSHIALGWPLKLTYITEKGSKIYYCWVSEGVPGKSLVKVMQNEKNFTKLNANLDLQSYSHLFITHYLTCPEDAQPDNFKVVQLPNQKQVVLYGLDVGQSFVGTHDDKRKVLSVKTVLYLLEPAIHQALNAHVLTRIMLLDPQAVIQHWQANLKQMNQLFKPLFEAELAKTRVPKVHWSSHNQLIDINEEVPMSVLKRLELLLNWLYQQPQKEKSGARLLKALEPVVALSYQSLRGKIKTPDDFYAIDPKAYVKNPATGKMYSSTTYASIQQNTLTPERLQASLNLNADYFASIDFRRIKSKKEQRYVLALLQAAINNKISFSYLNLSGCNVINETELFELLRKLPTLITLNLEDCLQFNLSTVINLLSFKVNESVVAGFFQWDYEVLCPALKKLSITIENEIKVFFLPANLSSRKQVLKFTTKWQQQFNLYWNKLLLGLTDKDEHVREITHQSLGKLTSRISVTQINFLAEKLQLGLKDKDWLIQEASYKSLHKLAPKLSANQIRILTEKLLFLVKNEDLNLRYLVHKNLVKLAPQLSKMQVGGLFKIFLALLKDSDWRMRKIGCESLVALAPHLLDTQVTVSVELLLSLLNDKDSEVRNAAYKNLIELAPQLSKIQVDGLFKTFLALLKDTDWRMRKIGCESLTALIPQLFDTQVDVLVELLLSLLKDKDSDVPNSACKLLIELAPRLTEAQVGKLFETLPSLLENSNWRMRKAGCELLAALASRPLLLDTQFEVLVKLLLLLLQDKNSDVFNNACELLIELARLRLTGKQVGKLFEILPSLLENSNWCVRNASCKALGMLAPQLSKLQADILAQGLLQKFKDEDLEVQNAAYNSLIALTPQLTKAQVKKLSEAFLSLQGSFSVKMRNGVTQRSPNICVEDLVKQLNKVQADSLFKKLLSWLKDKHLSVRKTSCRSLIALAPQLSETQIAILAEKLLLMLQDKVPDELNTVYQSLIELVPRLNEAQVGKLFETLLILQKDINGRVLEGVSKNLVVLATQLSVPQAKMFVEKLLPCLKDENLEVQNIACKILVVLAPQLSDAQVRKLLYYLKYEDLNVRISAGKILITLIPRLLDTLVISLSEILFLFKIEDSNIRKVANQILNQLMPRLLNVQVDVLFEIVLIWMIDEDLEIQNVAHKNLIELAPQLTKVQVTKFFETLLSWLKDTDWRVRRAGCEGLDVLVSRLSEEQVIKLFEELVLVLKDKDSDVQGVAVRILHQLMPKLLDVQVDMLFKLLLPWLSDENWYVRDGAKRNLVALAPRLSEAQVSELFDIILKGLKEKFWHTRNHACENFVALGPKFLNIQVSFFGQLLPLLNDEASDVRTTVYKILDHMAPRLSAEQAIQIVERLFFMLDNKDWDLRCRVIKSLTHFYSFKVQLPLLRQTILKDYENNVLKTSELAQSIDRVITQKIFSFLDKKTLLTIVPCISKDWQNWQKIYLQQQAEHTRMQPLLPSEDNSDSDAGITLESSLNRFLS